MSGLAISLMLQVSLLSADTHGNSYSQAYRQMQSDGQPLLILVGADWCPGCVTMKRSVMPRLESAGKLAGAVTMARCGTELPGMSSGKSPVNE